MHMSRKTLIVGISLVVVAVLVLVVLGIWLGSSLFGGSGAAAVASPYSVVYLNDGEIYFGKLSWFPKPHISDPWTIQRSVDKNNQVQLSMVEVNKSIWSPVDDLYLNPKQIMAWSALRADGNLAKALANPQLLQQQQQQGAAQGAAQPAGQPSSTFKGPTSEPPTSKQ